MTKGERTGQLSCTVCVICVQQYEWKGMPNTLELTYMYSSIAPNTMQSACTGSLSD